MLTDTLAIPTMDEHPEVQRYTRQRHDVEAKLARAQAVLADLTARRAEQQQAAHEAAVLMAIGEAPAAPPPDTEALGQLDADCNRATREVTILSEALDRLQSSGVDLLQRVQADVTRQAQAVVNELVAEMFPSIEKLLEQNAMLMRLSGCSRDVLVPTLTLLPLWIEQASKLLRR